MRADLHALEARSLPARSRAARSLAHRAADAVELVSELTPPADERQPLIALGRALTAERVALTDLGAAAAANDRPAYLRARARVGAASRRLSVAMRLLADQGVNPPALRVLYLIPAALGTAHSGPATSTHAGTTLSASTATQTQQALQAATVTGQAASPTSSSATASSTSTGSSSSSTPTRPASSTSATATVVVVPTGSGTASTSSTPQTTSTTRTSTIVVVPTR